MIFLLFLFFLFSFISTNVNDTELLLERYIYRTRSDTKKVKNNYFYIKSKKKSPSSYSIISYIELCKGSILDVYVKYCFGNTSAIDKDCDPNKHSRLLPYSGNFDYHVSGSEYRIYNGLCNATYCNTEEQYYIINVVTKGESTFDIIFAYYKEKDKKERKMFVQNKELRFDAFKNEISWDSAKLCSKYSTDYEECVDYTYVSDAYYRFGYHHQTKYNLNTMCGFDLYSVKNPIWVHEKTHQVIKGNDFNLDDNYYVNVEFNYVDEDKEIIRVMYNALLVKFESLPKKDFRVDFTLFGVGFLVIIIVFLIIALTFACILAQRYLCKKELITDKKFY